MPFVPHASPAVLADRNSNSAYEKLKFIEEHYEQLMAAYQDIMAHLKLVGNGGNGSSSEPVELPDNIVFYDSNSLSDAYPADVPNWNQITSKPYETLHTGCSLLVADDTYHLPKGILYLTTVNSNYNTYHLVSADGDVLFNVDELITTANVDTAISNYLSNNDYVTSSDIPEVPDMSGYVKTSEVANAANKIPRFNSQGHLVLPDGTEIWREE